MTERSWTTPAVQAVGVGMVTLAITAWLDGHAGTIHAVMAGLGLIVTFGDLIIAPSRWREGSDRCRGVRLLCSASSSLPSCS